MISFWVGVSHKEQEMQELRVGWVGLGLSHKEQEVQKWRVWRVWFDHKEQEIQEWRELWVWLGHKEQEVQEERDEGEQVFLTQTWAIRSLSTCHS